MTMAGIVMAQVGAGLAWRTNRRSLLAIGLFSNRFLLVGIAFEVALIAAARLHARARRRLPHERRSARGTGSSCSLWPPLVLGAEEARKASARRRRSAADVHARA